MPISTVLQLLATLTACVLFWRILKWFLRGDRFRGEAVAAGFLLRAALSTAAFFISWLKLPIASSLQTGNGLWFYALDGGSYFHLAKIVVASGAIGNYLNLIREVLNGTFIFAVAVSLILFGSVTSAVLPLNLFSYLGSCWILTLMGRRGGVAADLGILFFALSPAMILWSTQPLKDTFFAFLVMLALFAWQRSMDAAQRRHWAPFVLFLILGGAATAVASGVRAYFGLILCVAIVMAIPFYLARGRFGSRSGALLALLLLVAVFTRATLIGGGRVLPHHARVILDPLQWAGAGSAVGQDLGNSRAQFEGVGGASRINAGLLIRRMEHAQGSALRPPHSVLGRLVAGVSSTTTPRAIGQPLLTIVGGGRGLWAFAEIDTVCFAMVIVAAMAVVLRENLFTNPDLALTAILASGVAFPMMYAVSNFGSLLRLRGIVLAVVLMMIGSCRKAATARPEVVPNRVEPIQNVPGSIVEWQEAGAHPDVS